MEVLATLLFAVQSFKAGNMKALLLILITRTSFPAWRAFTLAPRHAIRERCRHSQYSSLPTIGKASEALFARLAM
jgi:hypothetical protein